MSKTTRRVRVALGDALQPVGEILFESDGRREMSLFRYAPAWLENPSRFAIAPALPLQRPRSIVLALAQIAVRRWLGRSATAHPILGAAA